jgi:hypothetical protein
MLKKYAACFVVLFAAFALSGVSVCASGNTTEVFQVYYEGHKIVFNADSGFPRHEYDEGYMFPLRKTLESVGIAVEYDAINLNVVASQESLSVRFAVKNAASNRIDGIYHNDVISSNGRTYGNLDAWFWGLFGYAATWNENHDRVDIKRVRTTADVPVGWYSITDEIGGALDLVGGPNLELGLPIGGEVYQSTHDFDALPGITVGMVYYKPGDNGSGLITFLQPVKIQYQLFRTGANGDVLVYEYDFPQFTGSIPPNREYFVSVDTPHWNKADMKPGRYRLVFNISKNFVYRLEGNSAVVAVPISDRIRGVSELEFEVRK